MSNPADNAPEATFSGPSLCQLTAREVVGLLRKGEVSPQECLEASLTRISEVEPKVNAMPIICAERARDHIAAMDSNPALEKDHPGYLAGLPVGIKDLNAVSGVRMTMGTPAMADYVPEHSDPLVIRLEQRGAIIVGKTNTPEMGAGGNTFNSVLGQTRNPFDIRKNAGGSSGGAAVSLATGEVWLSHGSDLAGSLRTPAAYCNVVGLRPTPGRVGGGGGPVNFGTEGVQGPMARNVGDLALFLDAMAGFEPRSPISFDAPARSFQQAISESMSNIRIAFAPDLNGFAPVEAEIEQIMRTALSSVEDNGAIVEADCPELPDLYSIYVTLRAMAWASAPGRLPQEIQSGFKQTLADNIALGHQLTTQQIYDAVCGRSKLFDTMQRFLQNFDVLACAVVGLEPGLAEEEYPNHVAGQKVPDYIDWLRFSFLATATSLPAVSLPAGFTKSGMPVGIQLIGQPRGEAKLLQVAKGIEDVLGLANCVPIDPR